MPDDVSIAVAQVSDGCGIERGVVAKLKDVCFRARLQQKQIVRAAPLGISAVTMGVVAAEVLHVGTACIAVTLHGTLQGVVAPCHPGGVLRFLHQKVVRELDIALKDLDGVSRRARNQRSVIKRDGLVSTPG